MKIIKVDINNPDKEAIDEAVKQLSTGGLVVYPTDTAYGLGVNAYNENAIRKLYGVKGRDFSKPTHVIVRNWKMIEDIAVTNELAKKLYDKFLPGPLTLILPKHPKIPKLLTAGLPTIGVRIPNSKITMQLSSNLKFPYTTPSANKSGGKTPYSIKAVKKELNIEKVDLILDAGKLFPTPPSTVVELTDDNLKILRVGPISSSAIKKVLD